jgi:hypothetical protein
MSMVERHLCRSASRISMSAAMATSALIVTEVLVNVLRSGCGSQPHWRAAALLLVCTAQNATITATAM